MEINLSDRVQVAGQKGSYRVTAVASRNITGVREFEDGSKGKEIKFDKLDVSRNYGNTVSQDDGKFVVALSYESQKFETRMLAKREKEAQEHREELASERRREQAMDDRFNGTQD
jgi:hypothetical protein